MSNIRNRPASNNGSDAMNNVVSPAAISMPSWWDPTSPRSRKATKATPSEGGNHVYKYYICHNHGHCGTYHHVVIAHVQPVESKVRPLAMAGRDDCNRSTAPLAADRRILRLVKRARLPPVQCQIIELKRRYRNKMDVSSSRPLESTVYPRIYLFHPIILGERPCRPWASQSPAARRTV